MPPKNRIAMRFFAYIDGWILTSVEDAEFAKILMFCGKFVVKFNIRRKKLLCLSAIIFCVNIDFFNSIVIYY